MLEVRELNYQYGNVQALRDVSLDVEQGEAVALIGGNGAGKTTLVRCISGALRPRSGRVRFEGEDIAGAPPHTIVRRAVVQVPEGRHLFPQQTVEANLLLGGYSHSRRRRQLQDRLHEMYELFPVLGQRHQQRAGTLSGGEQQMVAIGRALMAKPRLLILDEPSMGLAPMVVQAIFDTLRVLKQRGLSLLLVEQNARLALDLTDRGYVLESGRLALQGRSADLAVDPDVRDAYLGGAVQTSSVSGESGSEDWIVPDSARAEGS